MGGSPQRVPRWAGPGGCGEKPDPPELHGKLHRHEVVVGPPKKTPTKLANNPQKCWVTSGPACGLWPESHTHHALRRGWASGHKTPPPLPAHRTHPSWVGGGVRPSPKRALSPELKLNQACQAPACYCSNFPAFCSQGSFTTPCTVDWLEDALWL